VFLFVRGFPRHFALWYRVYGFILLLLFRVLLSMCLKASAGMKSQSDALLLLYEDWIAQQRLAWM
jgi:hypothetical protein